MSNHIRLRELHLHLARLIDMRKVDPATIIVAGCILYFIGCVGLFSTWKLHQVIDTASGVISGFGLLVLCVGILLIDNYLLFKFFALIGIILIMAFGATWLAHLPVLLQIGKGA